MKEIVKSRLTIKKLKKKTEATLKEINFVFVFGRN